jgi:hypothetical protein
MATKRQLESRFRTARKRYKKEQKIAELAQRRRNYWLRVADALEDRLGLVKEGQTEMKI